MMMKKLLNTAFTYTVIALVAGVGYREYTKMIDFTGETNLSLLHTHLFTLGMLFFLLVLPLIEPPKMYNNLNLKNLKSLYPNATLFITFILFYNFL